MIDPALRSRVESWRDDDPDAQTVAEVERLLAGEDEEALRARFDHPLTFGTAGLRGPIGAGPGRMNRAVVRRTAAGIARWLRDRDATGPVVIGRDARHGSADFASDSARVLAAAGHEVVVWDEPVPTPLLAYSLIELGCSAGIMVTASHNPPGDNGYKVYAAHGAQIAPPTDTEIAECTEQVGTIAEIDLAEIDDPRITTVPPGVRARYLDGVVDARVRPSAPAPKIAYTPMHGVGGSLLREAFVAAGLGVPTMVDAQAEPDPDFPTVAFPNPEEPGAMDLVVSLAGEVGADLALANDPDADRLAVAVPTDDGWRMLTGDEVGVLLADHLLRHGAGDDRLVATTVVSSTMLSRLAEAHAVQFVETLTGFKWLAQAARGRRLVLAYEEALGYCVGDLVHDKDGISAAVLVAELAGVLAESGSTLPDRLDELARTHGLHLTAQWSTRFEGLDGPAQMAARVASLRSGPPRMLGSSVITAVEDLQSGQRLPRTDAVILHADDSRVVVRPSGTEPKLKAYVEVRVPVSGSIEAARDEGRRRVEQTVAAVADLLS